MGALGDAMRVRFGTDVPEDDFDFRERYKAQLRRERAAERAAKTPPDAGSDTPTTTTTKEHQ